MTAANQVRPVPDGYTAVTPWIISRDTVRLLEFVKRAFGAEELGRVSNEDGSIGHAEVRIGGGVVMMFDARSTWPDTPAFLRLYVEDGDAVFRRALQAGAAPVTEMMELPFGNLWWIQERIEDVDPEEMQRRFGEQRFVDAMRYVQESLDRELSSRRRA